MVKKTTRKRVKKSPVKEEIKSYINKIFFSSQGLPIMLMLSVLGILFVLFRMKGVELNYQIAEIRKDVEKKVLEGKELKAHRARLLSVKKLRGMAKSYRLSQPKQSQVIVIPR